MAPSPFTEERSEQIRKNREKAERLRRAKAKQVMPRARGHIDSALAAVRDIADPERRLLEADKLMAAFTYAEKDARELRQKAAQRLQSQTPKWTLADIADALGVERNTAQHIVTGVHGSNRDEESARKAKLILEHWKNGATVEQIAKKVRTNRARITEVLRDNGLIGRRDELTDESTRRRL